MASVTLTAGTAISVDDVNKNAWSIPNNSKECDTSTCPCTLTDSGEGVYSEMLKHTNFGFAIPAGNIINGIEVAVRAKSPTAAAIELYSVYLVLDNVIQDVRRYDATKWTTSLVDYTVGGATDLWGESLDYNDVNSSTFGVAVIAKNGAAGSNQADIDCVQVTVYYSSITVDLGVELDVDNDTPLTGEYVELMVDVTNNSDYSTTGAHVHLTIPATLDYLSDSCLNGTYSSITGVWTIGNLASGQNTRLYILLETTDDGTHTITADVDSDITDSTAANDTDTLVLTSTGPVSNATWGFTYKNQHSSEYSIDIIDFPERSIRAPTTDTLSSVPGRDGELPLRQDDQPKKLTIGFKVFGTSHSDLRNKIYEIGRWMRTEKVRNNVPVTAELIFDDDITKRWIGYFVGEVTDKPNFNMASCTATFLVPDGTANNVFTNTSPASGTNAGSVTVPCKVYITAEATANMIVSNSQTGQSIYIVRDFEDGEEISIDTGKRIVTSNGRDIRSYVAFDSSFFKIQPGAFTITTTNGSIRKIEMDERYY